MGSWQKINNIIWGINKIADPTNLLKPGDNNVIKDGWPQGKPNRQYFNWILEECHNNLAFFETNGWPTWDATTTYDNYSIVRFGTKHYISLQTANLNKDPSTETSWWKDYFVWLTEQAGTEQTNQTVANFNDGYFYPHPEFSTGTSVNLTGDNLLGTDLTLYPLSANPLAIAVPTTVANTWYYIYVDIPAGSDIVAGDVSITTVTPSFNHATGMYESGTKRCIGYIEGHNTGNGEAEPFIVSSGWYQRQNEKKKLALYTPSPMTNTTLYAGVPNFDGKGLAEIVGYCYESESACFSYADCTEFTGNLADENLGWGSAPANHQYNGQVVSSITLLSGETLAPGIASSSNIITDSSGNILISGHNISAPGQDEAMAFWLKRFKLPRGIFSI
jgi:hypothetical protein